ncbi:hypothetical protein DFS33DRAFT_1385570 [Desarmillaria ectypa]|nr:hypothetical protein DFS33DRAFT_1385570 [Desarmillaria ectypa]
MGPERSITSEKVRRLVQAHTIRTSLIHERLCTTQRALDTLQTVHTAELAAERQTADTLRRKLAAYQERVRAAEAERDDMRQVVNELVDRVSVSKDFAAWPCSRLRATGLLEPAELDPPAPREQTMAYAAALIESLTTDRDAERRAHKRTTEVAKNTIAILEAQLALREAELESCLGHVPEDIPSLEEGEGEMDEMMSDEEALKVLELNVVRQRRIEMDTRALNSRLESIRSPPPNPIDALNAQIQQLAAQVDSFRAERQRLRDLIESEKLDTAGSPPREKPEIDLLEADKDEISMDLAPPMFPTTSLHHDPLPPPETNTPHETDLDLQAQLRDLHFS